MPERMTNWFVTAVTALCMGMSSVIGVLYMKTDNLEESLSAMKATRFTSEDGNTLRSDTTIQLNEVDKTISLMERDMEWIQKWVTTHNTSTANKEAEEDKPDTSPFNPSETHQIPLSAPAPVPSPVFPSNARSFNSGKPRYDVRQQEQGK